MPDLTLQPPLFHGLAVYEYNAATVRRLARLLAMDGEGVMGPSDFKVAATTPSASMAVTVAPGRALVNGDNVVRQGAYMLEEPTTLTVPIAANASGNPRIDLIVLRDYDSSADGGSQASDRGAVEVVQGTPGASPAVPSLPASAIPLARVAVANAAASITAANITDRRRALPGKRIAAGATGPLAVVPNDTTQIIDLDTVGYDPWGLVDLSANRIRLMPQGPSGLWQVSAHLQLEPAVDWWIEFNTNSAASVSGNASGSVGHGLTVKGASPAHANLSILLRTSGTTPDNENTSTPVTVSLTARQSSGTSRSVLATDLSAVYLGPE